MFSRIARAAVLCAAMGCAMLPFPSVLAAQSEGALTSRDVFLRPGDMLRISIWREPDLSGEFQVDLEGNVVLPMLGERNVDSIPMNSVIDGLLEDYQKEIRNPSINIVPLRQIFMLGDVARPGLYPVPPTTTLAGAVALAGGPSGIGDLNKIRVMRDGEVLYANVSMESAIDVVEIESGDQIYIGRTSWIKRNVPYLVGLGFTVVNLVVQFSR